MQQAETNYSEKSDVAVAPRGAAWKEYYELTKPRVVMLMVFTAFVGMLLATPQNMDWSVVFWANLGIAIVAGAAAAMNQWADQRIDAMMARTRARPLPTGQLSELQVITFATVLTVVGTIILVAFVNTLTAVLTVLSLFGYAVVYTMYLKRATPQNIVIGGAAGAAPPLLGWTAMTGTVDPNALLLFLIIFIWTPPHFWVLAIYRQKEYARVNIPMLPVTHGADYTRWQVVLYTVMLLVVSILPFTTGMVGWFYLVSAVALGSVFLYMAVKLWRTKDNELAMSTFWYSIIYLGALFGAMLIDRYIPIIFN